MSANESERERCYWVVSQNLNPNTDKSAVEWARASVRARVAFMGWDLEHPIGNKFAREIKPGDVILIGRRHERKPDVVGFGIVRGKYRKKAPRRTPVPDGGTFGSLRNLSSFIDMTGHRLPAGIAFIKAFRQTKAMAQIYPKNDIAHERICEWMDSKLPADKALRNTRGQVRSVALSRNPQMDYSVRKKAEVIKAEMKEAHLVKDYGKWLERKGRELSRLWYRRLQCDAFEKGRKNLIEAKSSIRREQIRMAVGQILDYAYQIKTKYSNAKMAILLPEKPTQESVNWLRPLRISVIWREGHGKLAFSDNAKGQFA